MVFIQVIILSCRFEPCSPHKNYSMKKCNHPTCPESGCRRVKKVKKKYRIKKVASKRVEANKKYRESSRLYLQQNNVCNIHSPVCTYWAQGVNHRKGKSSIELLLDQQYWEPACNACNGYIEEHDAWGRQRGHKLSKFNTNVTNSNNVKPANQAQIIDEHSASQPDTLLLPSGTDIRPAEASRP